MRDLTGGGGGGADPLGNVPEVSPDEDSAAGGDHESPEDKQKRLDKALSKQRRIGAALARFCDPDRRPWFLSPKTARKVTLVGNPGCLALNYIHVPSVWVHPQSFPVSLKDSILIFPLIPRIFSTRSSTLGL